MILALGIFYGAVLGWLAVCGLCAWRESRRKRDGKRQFDRELSRRLDLIHKHPDRCTPDEWMDRMELEHKYRDGGTF